MKKLFVFTFIFMCAHTTYLIAQSKDTNPEVGAENFTAFNREVSYSDGVAQLNANEGDGILWLNGAEFEYGSIELDIKGKNEPGRSFVGLAFHGKDNATFDAVYFRPFNFKNPERNTHSVQYISMPKNDWSTLRASFPGKYENTIEPTPNPVDSWFHVKITVEYPKVSVYVDGDSEPTLEVEQLSNRKKGKIGFWVGNGSEGWFKNLRLIPENI